MGTSAYTVDRDFRISRENVGAALAAVNLAFGQGFTDLAAAVGELSCFEVDDADQVGAFVLGRHADSYFADTQKLLTTLGRFAVEGSYVRFEGQDGDLFGFQVVNGQLREESGAYRWTLDPVADDEPVGAAGPKPAEAADWPQIGRERPIWAPLVFSRDPEAFDVWWAQLAGHRQDSIGSLLTMLRAEYCDIEYLLRALAATAYRYGRETVDWLRVACLAAGLRAGYLRLDLDAAHRPGGECDGVDMVLRMRAEGGQSTKYFEVSVFEGSPAALVAAVDGSPGERFAATVDAALARINAEIAQRDDFNQAARSSAL